MMRSLGVYVRKRDDFFVFVHKRCGNRAARDFAKNAIGLGVGIHAHTVQKEPPQSQPRKATPEHILTALRGMG